MNESDFEQELRSLKPVRPGRELENKIARELAPTAASGGWASTPGRSWLERLLPALGWGSLGAAAAVVVMLSLHLANGGLAPAKETSNAVAASADRAKGTDGTNGTYAATAAVTGDLLETNDEGLLDSGEVGVARRVRYSSVERRSWKDATGGITMVEIPREDVVVVPVSIQ